VVLQISNNRVIVEHELYLVLAATMRSFAHLPLRLSNHKAQLYIKNCYDFTVAILIGNEILIHGAVYFS